MSSYYPGGLTVDIFGILASDCGRNCDENLFCGEIVQLDVVVRFRREMIHIAGGTELGAALEISLRKKYFQTLFFSVQSCRYGVSYEISSRQISKKVIFLRFMCIFSCFFLVLLGKCVFG